MYNKIVADICDVLLTCKPLGRQ